MFQERRIEVRHSLPKALLDKKDSDLMSLRGTPLGSLKSLSMRADPSDFLSCSFHGLSEVLLCLVFGFCSFLERGVFCLECLGSLSFVEHWV